MGTLSTIMNAGQAAANFAQANKWDLYKAKISDWAKWGSSRRQSQPVVDGGFGDFGSFATNATAVMGGAAQILNNSQQLAQIGDTQMQENMISDIGNIGNYNYGSYDQLMMDYDRMANLQPDLSFDAIRGGSTKERIGNVLSSTVTGVTTGASVGGPYGALIGGALGATAGLAGWAMGDAKAEQQRKHLMAENSFAHDRAGQNLRAGGENLMNYQFRSGVAHSVAEGGPIERKMMSIQAYANKVLRRPRLRSEEPVHGIVREHCKGGTMVRIKR